MKVKGGTWKHHDPFHSCRGHTDTLTTPNLLSSALLTVSQFHMSISLTDTSTWKFLCNPKSQSIREGMMTMMVVVIM